MKSVKIAFSQLQGDIIRRKNMMIGIIILFLGFIYFFSLYRIRYFQSLGLSYSIADGYVHALKANQFGFTVLFPFLLFVSVNVESDFDTNKLIRQLNREILFKIQLIKMILLSLGITLFLWLIVMGIYSRYTSLWINWDQSSSVYAIVNHSTNDVSFFMIQFVFFISSMTLLMFNFSLFIVCRWIFQKNYVGWLTIIVLLLWDMKQWVGYQIVYKFLGIGYERFVHPFRSIIFSLIFVSIVILVIRFISKKIIKRVEFI